MSTPRLVPMISPDGDIGDIPEEKVQDAVGKGFQMGQDMIAPDGKTTGTIPVSKVHDAIKKGYQMKPPAAAGGQFAGTATQPSEGGSTSPQLAASMQSGPEGLERDPNQAIGHSAFTGPGAWPGQRPVQGKDLIPGAIGGSAAAATVGGSAALSTIIPPTIAGIKAVGAWAKENPVHAYFTYQALKELIPGMKKAMGIVDKVPDAK